MSVTIDSLDIQIKTSAGQASDNIDNLATALGRLKGNSNLTKVTNNLNKLATSLTTLNSSMRGLNGLGRLEKLSTALGNLNGIQKLSGLSSALKTLQKLPDIMSKLDSATLDKFAARMEKLATAMAPLAVQINAVGNGFAKLPSKLTSAVSATNKLTVSQQKLCDELNVTNANLYLNMSNLEMFIGVAQRFITTLAGVIDQAIGWDGIQFRFGRAFGEDAEEMYEYILKINEALGINVQEFMQYSSMYGSLLSGFGLTQDKVTTISIGLSELTYDLWAANNDVVKRYEDVATAVKSAITGEIEPIRNLGIAMTEASLQEFIDGTHLAGMSIENMTEAQKAEVRYAAMVNAAMNQGIVGTYAKEMHTAEGAVRDFSQTLKTLYQAFGSLFIPILQAAVPYITAFVEILTDAVHAVADFFGIELFKIDWSNQSNGIGGLADGATDAATGLGGAAKAAKKLKDYTMGFDELNVINPDSGSSGSGGGGAGGAADWGSGLDLDTLWDDSVLEQAKRKVDELKQNILEFADKWKWAFAIAGVALTEFVARKSWPTLLKIGTSLITQFSKVGNVFSAVFGALKGNSAASSALTYMFPTLSKIATAISGVASAVGTFLAGISAPMWVAIAAAVAGVASVVYFLYENWDKVVQVVKNFFDENIAPKLEELSQHWEDLKSAVKDVAESLLNAFPPELKKILVTIGKLILDFGGIFEAVGGVIFGIVGGVIATAFNILVGLVENAMQIFTGLTQIVSGVVQFLVALFTGDFSSIYDITKTVAEGIQNLFDGMVGFVVDIVVDFVDGIISWFTELWDELVGHSIVPDMIDGIVEWFGKLPTKILGPLKTFVDDVITKFKELWSSIKKWYSTNVAPKFTVSYWQTTFDTIRSGLKTKLDEAWKAVKDFFSVSEWKKKVTDAMDAIKKNFKLPEFPKIKLSITYDKDVGSTKKAVYKALGLSGWPSLKWSTYAMGGMPSMGEMFIAREAGPELVGRIGNHSAVANNDQIVEAVSRGVYDAVRAANGGNGDGGQTINVYLDGKQIYASIKRVESSRGANLMGNQLGYLY